MDHAEGPVQHLVDVHGRGPKSSSGDVAIAVTIAFPTGSCFWRWLRAFVSRRFTIPLPRSIRVPDAGPSRSPCIVGTGRRLGTRGSSNARARQPHIPGLRDDHHDRIVMQRCRFFSHDASTKTTRSIVLALDRRISSARVAPFVRRYFWARTRAGQADQDVRLWSSPIPANPPSANPVARASTCSFGMPACFAAWLATRPHPGEGEQSPFAGVWASLASFRAVPAARSSSLR